MNTRITMGAALAAGLLAFAGCKQNQGGSQADASRQPQDRTAATTPGPDSGMARQGEPKSAASSELERAEQASRQAADDQKKAADRQGEVADAQKEMREAEEKRADAQQKAQQGQTESQQAQQQAQQSSQEAQQATASAQQTAEQQRQQAGSAQATAQRTAIGELVRADASEIVLRQQSGEPDLRLRVDPGTPVMVNGEQRSASDLQEGMQVRASYEDHQGQPKAVRIEAQPSSGAATRSESSSSSSTSPPPQGGSQEGSYSTGSSSSGR